MMRVGFQGQLGDVYSDVVAIVQRSAGTIGDLRIILDKIGPHMVTVRHVLEDPALDTVLSRIETIRDLEPPSTGANAGAPTGIALHRIVPVLDGYIWFRRNQQAVTWGALALGALLAYKLLRKKAGS